MDTRLPFGSFLTKSFSWKYVKYYDIEKYCSRSKKSFFKEKLYFALNNLPLMFIFIINHAPILRGYCVEKLFLKKSSYASYIFLMKN